MRLTTILFILLLAPFSYSAEADMIEFDRVNGVKLTIEKTTVQGNGVDILFVIDDSASMSLHQNAFQKHIEYFTKELAAIATGDRIFNIGVTTSSIGTGYSIGSDGQLVNGLITTQDPNWAAKLQSSLRVGTEGNATEKSFEAASLALQNSPTTGFHRANTPIYLVFVTDEDMQVGLTPADLHKYMLTLVPSSEYISASSFVPVVKTASCDFLGTPMEGSSVIDFVSILGGKNYDLCDVTNLPTAAQELGANIKSVLKEGELIYRKRIKLFGEINVATLSALFAGVYLQKGDATNGFTFDATTNEIIFGSEVDFSADPSKYIYISYKLKNFN